MAEIDAILYDVINKSQAASRKINLALDINPDCPSVSEKCVQIQLSRYPKQVVTLTHSSGEFEYCR